MTRTPGQKTLAACHESARKETLNDVWNRQSRPAREYEPTYTLDWHIAQARKEMGEEKWAEYNAGWEK